MKKFIPAALIIIIMFSLVYYNYDIYKRKDIGFVLEDKLTKGIFNKYKLDSITSYELTYSDVLLTIMLVKGIGSSSTHMPVTYKVLLEKQSSGSWKVKGIYVVK